MKNHLLFPITAICGFALSHAAFTVNNTGDTFTPATITVKTTDTVVFTLASIHTVVEVNQTTYNANGNTPLAGGFSLPSGGGKLMGLTVGTHFYVCGVHYAMGMKGQIIVQATAIGSVPKQNLNAFTFQITGADPIVVNLPGKTARISVINIEGRIVWSAAAGKNGARNLSWNGKLADGHKVATGTYFVQSTALDAWQKPVGKMYSTLVQLR